MNAADMRTGPPDRRKGPHRSDTARPKPDEKHTFQSAPPVYRYPDGLRRRRAASYRLPPLASGRRDPWFYDPPGQRGYEAAALHLLEHGLMPAANREGLQTMHDRQAAQLITDAWELVA